MTALTLRERRLVVVLILIALIALVWQGLVWPIAGGFLDRATERGELTAEYQRNSRILGNIAYWRRLADAQARTASRFELAAPNGDAAAQMLMRRLTGGILRVGGVTRSVAADPADAAFVRAHLVATLTIAQLTAFLTQLENEEPYVVVEHASVRADAAFQSGHAGPMDVKLQVRVALHPVRKG